MTRPAPKAEAGRAVSTPAGPLARLWQALRRESRFWRGVIYDARRFRRHAWLHRARSEASRDARMLADAHFLEYGMALRAAQPGFGRARAVRLAGDLQGGGQATDAGGIGRDTLRVWTDFNAGDVPDAVAHLLGDQGTHEPTGPAGVTHLNPAEIARDTAFDYLAFARSRHSLRRFGADPVPQDKIRRAAEAAQYTPSSCNRQTCHLHVWTERALIDRVRAHQAGNRTFGHELGGIAVITSDLRHWEHSGERYQAWIDGGLFAMSFVHALHAEGLGTCMLNWSVDVATDKALRRTICLDDAHAVIVLVGFGTLAEDLTVCASTRLPIETVLSMNPPLA
ncbi:Nitroreductase [Salipiger thiooxidans]|uniref:Nitroreductase n=1 Tax=Salipiger thiooxidans TaxID=282683 RepID=A0A1G7LJ19_9RHOB|nr:nitroreductase family protein [Salipiger thiooxidans]SDF49354.1 Nitroreductase [Salipiger thiooxidans]